MKSKTTDRIGHVVFLGIGHRHYMGFWLGF